MLVFWLLENWKITAFFIVMLLIGSFYFGRSTAPTIQLDAAVREQLDKWTAEQLRTPGKITLKPGDSTEWVGLDDRKRTLWISPQGIGIVETWLNGPGDPEGLKPLSEEEFNKVKEELKKLKDDRPYWTDTSHSPEEQEAYWKERERKKQELTERIKRFEKK